MRTATRIRLGALALVVVSGAALALTGLLRSDEKPADGKIVVATYQVNREILPLMRMGIVEGLTSVDFEFGTPRPAVVKAFERETGGVWRFELRPGQVFHDGTPVDAKAVVASIRRFQDSPAGAHVRDLLVASVRDEWTVVVAAAAPTIPVPGYLGRIPILAASSFDAEGRLAKPVGTGPFAVKEIAFDEGATLVANARFRDGPPRLDEIDLRVVKDPGTRVLMLETGDADWIMMVPRHEVGRLRRAGYQVHGSRYLYNVYLLFNTRKGPGADPDFRRGAAAAIDRDRIARVAFEGTADPAESLFPTRLPFVPGDLPTAEDAPMPEGKSLEVVTPAEGFRPAWATAAELVRQDLEAAGVKTTIRVLEMGAWNARVRAGDYEATIRGRVPALWPDPLACLRYDFASDGPANVTGFSDPELDARLEKGLAAPDEETRAAAVEVAQRILARALPVVPLVHDFGRETYAARPGLGGASDEWSRVNAYPGPGVFEKEPSHE